MAGKSVTPVSAFNLLGNEILSFPKPSAFIVPLDTWCLDQGKTAFENKDVPCHLWCHVRQSEKKRKKKEKKNGRGSWLGYAYFGVLFLLCSGGEDGFINSRQNPNGTVEGKVKWVYFQNRGKGTTFVCLLRCIEACQFLLFHGNLR